MDKFAGVWEWNMLLDFWNAQAGRKQTLAAKSLQCPSVLPSDWLPIFYTSIDILWPNSYRASAWFVGTRQLLADDECTVWTCHGWLTLWLVHRWRGLHACSNFLNLSFKFLKYLFLRTEEVRPNGKSTRTTSRKRNNNPSRPTELAVALAV